MSERGRRVVVVVLTVVAVGLVFVASAVKSYLPLFFVWVPQLGIPVFLARTDRRPPVPVSGEAPGTPGAPGEPPSEA